MARRGSAYRFTVPRRILPPPSDDGDTKSKLSLLSESGPGSLPISFVPWGVIVARRRVAASAQARDGFANLALAIVLGAMFMVNLSVTAITVAVPRIAADFGASESTIVWAVTGPILVTAVLAPTFGKLGDQWGHRTVFLAGLVVNAIFTVLIAAAQSDVAFLAFRLLAAVGGAAIGPSALAFINRLFVPRERATALGWWSFVGAGSPVIGVVVGGYIIDEVGWRWVFVTQAPLVFLAAMVAALVLPQTSKQPDATFDLPGAVSLGLGIGSLLLAVTLAASDPLSIIVFGTFALAVGSLFLFARIERTSLNPLIPPHYWRLPGFIIPTVTLALMFAAYMGSFVLAPLMLQSVAFGFTAAATSRVIIARPLLFSLTGPITGRLAQRLGERFLAIFGGLAIVVSMLMLSRSAPELSLWFTAAALGLAGVGMGAAAPVLTASVANSVADEDLGVAGAAQQMLQQVGLVLGVQALLAIQGATQGDALDGVDNAGSSAVSAEALGTAVNSYRFAFVGAAVLALFGVVSALALPRRATTQSELELSRVG